ncbi:MAG: hypothetical protein LRZ85_04355 [Alphaproteobacteria bacterium]|nr:hypothetical protein [Alphaproteobacteria bacterium]
MAISSRSSFIVAGALSAALAACSAEPKNAVFECKTPGKDQSATVYESGGVFTLKTHEVVSGHVADETKFFW